MTIHTTITRLRAWDKTRKFVVDVSKIDFGKELVEFNHYVTGIGPSAFVFQYINHFQISQPGRDERTKQFEIIGNIYENPELIGEEGKDG